MSSSKDKCQVSEDKYRDRKNEIFPRSDKLDRMQKGKRQTSLEGVYKRIEVEGGGGQKNYYSEKYLEQYRQLFVFVIRSATQLGFLQS